MFYIEHYITEISVKQGQNNQIINQINQSKLKSKIMELIKKGITSLKAIYNSF